jgi:hypothetical protein
MGYAVVLGPCACCRQSFTYNPIRVPSVRFKKDGEREPVCLDCITRANIVRKQSGLEEIVPLPGAYEPVEESEL